MGGEEKENILLHSLGSCIQLTRNRWNRRKCPIASCLGLRVAQSLPRMPADFLRNIRNQPREGGTRFPLLVLALRDFCAMQSPATGSRKHPPRSAWGGIIRSNESSHFRASVVMGSDTEGVGVDKGLAQINTMLAGWVKEKNHNI